MQYLIENLSSVIGIYLLISFAIVAVFIAANHEWKEKGSNEVKGLILYYPKKFLDEKIESWEKNGYSLLIRRLFILLPVSLLFSYYVAQSFYDVRYAWGLFVGVGFILYPKKLSDIWVMFLGCFRCMPTLWVGIPSIFYILLLKPLDFFSWIPFVFFSVAVISYLSTVVYMLYAFLKTAIEKNCNERDCLELDLAKKKNGV